eukprot:2912424-Prymnesium_polylepis.1
MAHQSQRGLARRHRSTGIAHRPCRGDSIRLPESQAGIGDPLSCTRPRTTEGGNPAGTAMPETPSNKLSGRRATCSGSAA